MTTHKNEHISGLMDSFWADEKALDSSLNTLYSDPEAKAKWARYHLMRDALQDEIQSPLDAGFASRVSAAIENEPAIVAFPAQSRSQDDDVSDYSAADGGSNANPVSNVKKGNFSRNLVGFSVAATVAVVSLVGLNVFQSTKDASVGNPNPEIAQVPTVVSEPLINGDIQLVSNPVGSYWVNPKQEAVSPEFATRLNMYLSEHIESSSTGDIKGMLPYSRLAGFDSRRPKADAQ